MLEQLARARHGGARGFTLLELGARLRTDPLQVEPVLEQLVALDWVARLAEPEGQRIVLLAEPGSTRVQPLVDAMLLKDTPAARAFRERAGIERMTLADLIGAAPITVH
jgi:membrane protein